MDDWDLLIPVLIMAIVGAAIVLASAIFIRAVVQWVNRRDDPRRARRPADAP
jgi:hypothetical protein